MMTKRYALVSYADASESVRRIYDDFLKSTGLTEVPIWMQSMGASEALLSAYWERVKGSLMSGTLPIILKELVLFVVSIENGAPYCSSVHAHAALSLDPTLRYEKLMGLVESLRENKPTPRDLESNRSALDFAYKVAQDPNSIGDDDFAKLEAAGYSRDEVQELVSVIDMGIMFNCYTSALKLPIDTRYKPYTTTTANTEVNP